MIALHSPATKPEPPAMENFPQRESGQSRDHVDTTPFREADCVLLSTHRPTILDIFEEYFLALKNAKRSAL